jgi:diguanylate cyclase (GGDEF)-like protein
VALAHRATHDLLTGLPNRALFLDRLGHALTRASRAGQTCAVLFLDLDGFKEINDSLGHAAGDRVLAATAERLQACVRAADTLARLGGDEFVILLEEVADNEAASQVAERLGEALSRPFPVAQRAVAVSASVGIALSVSPDDRPEDLLRCADVAMYRAKAGGKGNYAFFYQGLPAAANAGSPASLTTD